MEIRWSDSWGHGLSNCKLADSCGPSGLAVGDSGFLTVRLADSWGSGGLTVGDSSFRTVRLADSWGSGCLTIGVQAVCKSVGLTVRD